jgi:predicted house-cleaning noncanonical NTP pyrophosphatase (MazG superfamily)
MSTKIYNKLVRDRIPGIIAARGAFCEIEFLNDADYLALLDKKLDEELAEYHQDQNLEELADLLEVIYACAAARGYSIAELEALRAKKAAERGGFGDKILLKSVIEED